MKNKYIIIGMLLGLVGIIVDNGVADMDVYRLLRGDNYTRGDYLGRVLYVTFLKDELTLEKRSEQEPSLQDSGTPPYEMNARCYVTKNNKLQKKVSSLNDFQGFAVIDSEQKAIEFVRLRTSENTFFLFRPETMIEVFDRDDEKSNDHLLGGASGAFMKKHKLSNIRVVKKNGYYEITRYLINYSWPGAKEFPSAAKLFHVLEKVYPNGRYLIEKTLYMSDIDYKDIAYPLPPK